MTKQQPEGGRDELADLRAEVEALRAEVEKSVMAVSDAESEATFQHERAKTAIAEVEKVTFAFRNAADWADYQHRRAEKAEAERDALQRQVDDVRALTINADQPGRWVLPVDEDAPPVWVYDIDAALDAVEPADQPGEAWCEHYAPAGECETCTPPADQPQGRGA